MKISSIYMHNKDVAQICPEERKKVRKNEKERKEARKKEGREERKKTMVMHGSLAARTVSDDTWIQSCLTFPFRRR